MKSGAYSLHRDLVHWRSGRDWSNQFVYGLGQGGGFAYLRFKSADPPRQVYWGVAGPRQHEYLAGLLGAQYSATENRSFKFAWRKACQAVDVGTPPVLGPLDMFYGHHPPPGRGHPGGVSRGGGGSRALHNTGRS